MKQKFFFPLNYDYSNKFIGIIEYKLLTPLIIYGIILIVIISQFNITFFQSSGIFIVLFFPIFFLLNSKVYSEPFYSFIIAIIKHYINGKIYLYKRVIWCGINPNYFCLYLLNSIGPES